MCDQNFRHVLFPGFLTGTDFSRRSRGGRSAHRCTAGTLNTRVHVGFVIKANVNHVMAAFHRAGKRLKSDIHRTAVAGHADHFDVTIVNPAFFPQRLETGFDAGCNGRCIFKRDMNPGHFPRRGGKHAGDDFMQPVAEAITVFSPSALHIKRTASTSAQPEQAR